jgi:hypothetical protein
MLLVRGVMRKESRKGVKERKDVSALASIIGPSIKSNHLLVTSRLSWTANEITPENLMTNRDFFFALPSKEILTTSTSVNDRARKP